MTKRGGWLVVVACMAGVQQSASAQTVSSPVIVFSTQDILTNVSADLNQDGSPDVAVMDISLSTITSGSTRYWLGSVWNTRPDVGGIWYSKMIGGLDRPLAGSDWKMRSHTQVFPNTTAATHGLFWIANVYQHPDGVLAFIHVEGAPEGPGDTCPNDQCSHVGLAWSVNGGYSYTYLGKIISANPESTNIQGIPYVVKDGYFYAYYHDGAYVAVARALLSDVIAQAKLGQTLSWMKFYNGSFSQAGVGGLSSSLTGNPFGISHTDAAYSTYNGKIYLATSIHTAAIRDAQGNCVDFPTPSWIDLYESPDGVSFTKIMRLDERLDQEVFHGFQYITFVDENGGDNSVVGQRFHVYGMTEHIKPTPPDCTYPFVSRETGLKWTVDLGTPTDFYRLSTDYSATQGFKNWFYKYATPSAFINMIWNNIWQGNDPNLVQSAIGGHPGPAADTALEWKAPHAGVVMVAGTVTDMDRTCGDGVTATIELNGSQPLTGTRLWKGTIDNDDTVGVSHHLALRVETNDVLRFQITRRGDNYCDTTRWDPTVAFVNDSWIYASGFSSTHHLNRWSYHGGTADLTYDAGLTWWKGSESGYPILAQGWTHPGPTMDAVLKWSAPYAGTVRITGTASDANTGCGDGVDVTIMKGGVSLWGPATVSAVASAAHDVAIEVAPGDEVTFVTNGRANHFCDATTWNPKVEYVAAWRASAGFSDVQEMSRWRYESSLGSASMTYDGGTNWWRGPESGYPILSPGSAHPGPGSDAILKWLAPRAGTVRVMGRASDGSVGCGDGVIVSIKKAGTTVWGPTTIVDGDTVGVTHNVSVAVAAGDDLTFITNRASANHFCDSTTWDPLVWYQ